MTAERRSHAATAACSCGRASELVEASIAWRETAACDVLVCTAYSFLREQEGDAGGTSGTGRFAAALLLAPAGCGVLGGQREARGAEGMRWAPRLNRSGGMAEFVVTHEAVSDDGSNCETPC